MSTVFESYDEIVRNLISQVRKEDQDAFEELLEIYDPLIVSFVNRFFNTGVSQQDAEDFKQELTLTFYNAILSYDLSQTHVSFGLYAKICMNNFFITQLRALKKRRGLETVSLEETSEEGNEVKAEDDLSADMIRREEMREWNKKIEVALSKFEYKVWQYYFSGCSSREIAEELGRTEKSIENAIFRIRNKLKVLFS